MCCAPRPIPLVVLALLLVWLYPPPARACGGFFCSSATPVNQAAERIIFVDHGDGTVTAVVQVLYEGPSERFAWLLPVPGTPDVSVSSNVAFDRLQAATNPTYNLRVRQACLLAGVTSEQSNPGGYGGATTPVAVVASGTVGPYDYAVISVAETADDPAQTAVDWLVSEGYDVTTVGPDVLRPYLAVGDNLIAFRLSKDVDAGQIRPIVLRYATELPMIPIRPTAVAANEDMGILVWVVGESRAIPTNYQSLVLNEAAIDWFDPGSTYDAVIGMAADEAGGQGFVTEMAAPSAVLEGIVWSSADESVHRSTFGDAGGSASKQRVLAEAVRLYGAFDGLRDVIAEHVPLPDGASVEAVIECIDCVFGDDAGLGAMDLEAFVTALELTVVDPLRDTQALLDSRPYVTRLYTTMSADEMTLDPCFDFNADLPDVDNIHIAEMVVGCPPGVTSEVPWRVDLPGGGVVRGRGPGWPFGPDAMPATREIRRESTVGEGAVLRDNTAVIRQALAAHNRRITEDGCGCATTRSDAGPPLWLGVLVSLVCAVRRRR